MFTFGACIVGMLATLANGASYVGLLVPMLRTMLQV